MTTCCACPVFDLGAGAAGLPLVRRTGTVLSARAPVRSRMAGLVSQAHGVRQLGRAPFRPVLKHGPRSLTDTQVEGSYTKPRGAMKVKGGVGRLRWDPGSIHGQGAPPPRLERFAR